MLSHQSNGTVAFSTTGDSQRLADAVVARLGPVCGHDDVVPVRSLAWLAGLVLDELPDGCELTVVDGPSRFSEPLPWRPDGQEVTVLRADRRHAIVLNHQERRSRGTSVIEARLSVRATSRGVGTVLRLMDRLARLRRCTVGAR